MEITEFKKSNIDVTDLENRVKSMYRKVALHPEVQYHFEMGKVLAEKLGYPPAILKRIPQGAIESFAGVGYFFDCADLQAGETVVDMGSGSGMDVFYAALEVGPSGRVIGVDMTKEQLEKSIFLSNQHLHRNVFFQHGHIENLPIESDVADIVISNGVINLSAYKKDVFKEAHRVLRSGGRLAIADIVSSVVLPENISCDATLWAACIGGALQIDQYKSLITEAGFKIVNQKENPYEFLSKNARGATEKYGITSISLLAVKD